MIIRKLTNLYLSDLDLLTEALYFCWTKSFCIETDQLDKEKLKEQILSYDLYEHKYAIKKEIPVNFINKLEFKTLVWVNEFVDKSDDIIWSGYTELYKQVIDEIEINLFVLKHKTAQIAYGNILLRNLDKSHIHKRKLSSDDRNMKYKETFDIVLNRKFLSENKDTIQNDNGLENYPNYDLTARLINHLDFIDKLIELFSCFEINLKTLADNHKHNLYIFYENENYSLTKNEIGTTSIGTVYFRERERINSKMSVTPKLHSTLSDECLIKIMQYLSQKEMLINPNLEVWLFWFNRKYVKVPEPLKWDKSPTMLSNIIQHLCGKSIAATIKTVFYKIEYKKPTRKIYESSKLYKEIEQIITIAKQKI